MTWWTSKVEVEVDITSQPNRLPLLISHLYLHLAPLVALVIPFLDPVNIQK
jgi:hypothetical protein